MPYYKKENAVLKLNKSNNKNLKLIQEDKNINGEKIFYIMDNRELYTKIKKKIDNNITPNYYESWTDNTNLLFSLDIDINDKNINIEEILVNNIKLIIKYGKKFYNYEYKTKNIFLLKSINQTEKYSYHIIFRGLIFENNKLLRNFYDRINELEELKYCDKSIYNLTCLRTCFSSKKSKDSILTSYKLKINGKETMGLENYENEFDYFEKTLITNIDYEDKEFIKKEKHVDIEKIENDVDLITEIKSNNDIENILSYLPSKYCEEFNLWNKVGICLFSIDENNKNIFKEFSKKSNKYHDNYIDKLWEGYKKNINKNLIGIGSLIHWAKEGGYENNNNDIEKSVSSYTEDKIIITKKNLNIDYINEKKLNTDIFEKLNNKNFIGLQSEKGTGKTSNLIKTIFENDHKKPESVLFISSRRTFGIKLLSDLKKYGFKLYSEIEDTYIYDKKIIIQIDSLLRLQIEKFDLIIIDECESLARYLTSSHFTKNIKSSTIVSNLEYRIYKSNKLIIMDADLSDRCINYFTKLKYNENIIIDDIQIIVNNYTPFKEYNIKYMSYNIWLNEIKKKICDNKKLVVPMASNNKAKDLYNKLKQDFQEKNIILIHKETNDEDKLIKLLNVNENWINYDIVIYTPTVCMGVSFDEIHFDYIFGYGCHNSLGSQEFCQMLHRVRSPKNNDIYLSFDYYNILNPIEDKITFKDTENILCNDFYLTLYNIDCNFIKKKYTNTLDDERCLYYPYKEEPIYDIYVRNSNEMINNKLNFTACFFGYVKFKKYNLEYHTCNDTDNIIDELKELRKIREEEEKNLEAENIYNSKLLTTDEYKNICMRSNKYMTDEDYYEIKKYNLMNNYNLNEENFTKELILKYNDKTLLLNYNNLSTIIKSDQNTEEKLEILLKNENNNIIYRNCYQQFTNKNKYTYHYYALTLLSYTGFNINDIDKHESQILEEMLIDNLNSDINGLNIIDFLNNEKYGIYYKFDCKYFLNQKFENNYLLLIKIINSIIFKQYGIKIKKLSKGKIKTYYLSTNNLWNDLPNKITGKNVKEYIKKEITENVCKNLDEGLFID